MTSCPDQPKERVQIAFGGSKICQVTPDCQPRQRIIDLGLREQALRVRQFDYGRQAAFVPCLRLDFSCAGSLELDGRVFSHAASALQHGPSLLDLVIYPEQRLAVITCLRLYVRLGGPLLGMDSKNAEDRERHGQRRSVIFRSETKSIAAALRDSGWRKTRAQSGDERLNVKVRIVGMMQDLKLSLRLPNAALLFHGSRM